MNSLNLPASPPGWSSSSPSGWSSSLPQVDPHLLQVERNSGQSSSSIAAGRRRRDLLVGNLIYFALLALLLLCCNCCLLYFCSAATWFTALLLLIMYGVSPSLSTPVSNSPTWSMEYHNCSLNAVWICSVNKARTWGEQGELWGPGASRASPGAARKSLGTVVASTRERGGHAGAGAATLWSWCGDALMLALGGALVHG